MQLRWIISCGIGEALGIAVVAATYAALDRGLLHQAALPILGAGAWEGLCLGTAQAIVLSRFGVRPLRWIGATMLGAVIGYALSLAGGAGGEGGSALQASEPAMWLMALLGAGLGVAMGSLLGAVQWLVARRAIGLRAWVIANAIGWAPAMAIVMLAAGMPERTWSLPLIAGVGAIAGALAGLSVSAATAPVVRRVAARTS